MDTATTRNRNGVLEPAEVSELGEILARAGASGQTIELGGCFSKDAMGGAIWPADTVVSTRRLGRVVQYEPRDLTIGVEAGMRMAAVNALLEENHQMLPLDPPLSDSATVGGVVAANCSGPRRRLYGSARDMVIGMTFVTVDGKQVRSGGMVVKNVAGLDMAKLLVGSFGTLAAIARVNFKLVPKPLLQKTFLLTFESMQAGLKARDAVLRSVLQPMAIDLANAALGSRLGLELSAGNLLLIEAGGSEAVIARYEREIKTIARETAGEFSTLDDDQARRVWLAVRDFPAFGGANDSPAVVRLSTTLARLGECFAVAGDLPALARAGSGIVYVHCRSSALELVTRARQAGLYAVVESSSEAEKSKLELWADPGPELEMMIRIKHTLDPQNLLNRGRLYNRL